MSNDYQIFTKDHSTGIQTTDQKSEPAHAYNLRYNKRYLFIVFYIEQKLLGKRKSDCNRTCRSSCNELRTIEFHFFRFLYNF